MLDTLITLIRCIQETSKSSSQGSKGTGHFSKQTANKEKATEPKCQDVQTPVFTEARENIHQTISNIRRLVRNRRGPLGYVNCAWGTESRLWTSHHWQLFRACIPITPWVVGLEPVCLRAAEQRSYTSSPTLARQLQLSVPCNQVNRGVDADTKIYFQPQCLHVLPSCVMETPRSILGAIQKG